MTRKLCWAALAVVSSLAGVRGLAGDGEKGLLVHLTDSHVPVVGCEKTLEAVAPLVSTADALVVTGDLTEFGGLESFASFERIFSRQPVLPTLGNHDATWRSLHDVFF